MTNPLVSIIVPVYNAQNSVARCLESICGQTYQELEIIVLNDGSTDDSLTICNQFCAKDSFNFNLFNASRRASNFTLSTGYNPQNTIDFIGL